MKIIDLLIKINNKEEIPKKIKYEDTIFEYNKDIKDYITEFDNGYYKETLLYKITNKHTYFIENLLRGEVEIIEENKEIEELHILDKGESNDALYEYCSKLSKKQNELVREVNKLIKERKEKTNENN